jgi:NADPH-dependent glutamate synthase beta subunit-like oxidoreductase
MYKTITPDFEFWQQMIPCQAACPVHTDAGKYVQLIAAGKDEQAYLTARSPNPFASICGRVCAAPCEDRCRRGALDAPVTIRGLKRFVTEKYGVESLQPETQAHLITGGTEPGNKTQSHLPILTGSRAHAARGQKVAVIGAGPAGLSCAHDLALMGYRVTVFEATEAPGGMMVHGIPEFRLSRSIIDKEIAKIVSLGVELKPNAPLTPQFGLKQLRDLGYEAVFLGVGTQRGRDLRIEGADLDGVIKAIDFLLNVNRGYRVELGKRVVVIGGGLVAFDAARMALRTTLEQQAETTPSEGAMVTGLDAARAAVRSGVAEVCMISLESFDEMPFMRTAQGREEFEEAQKEGIVFLPQRGAKLFKGEGGRVRTAELIGVERTYDENGRFAPVYNAAISETIEADTFILAIGQQADLSFLKPEDGLELMPQGTLRVNGETLATTAEGVFAGGDVAFGPRTLIVSIAEGKRAALSIDNYLRHVTAKPVAHLEVEKIPTRSYRRSPGYEKCERQSPPTIPLGRRTGISEVETGYGDEEARRQAERCLYCHIQTIYDPEKCVLCNRCVDICPEYCLKLIPIGQLDVDPAEKETLLSHYQLDNEREAPLSAMLKDDEKCIRCGLCAIRCPTDAMTMEVFFYEESEAVR